MTEDFFRRQIERLKLRFGAKAFDPEFVRLIGVEVASVPDDVFLRTISTFIGNRKNNNPPLLVDFKESRIAWEKGRFTDTVKKASNIFDRPISDVMREHYQVDSIKEALAMEKLKIRIKESNEKG